MNMNPNPQDEPTLACHLHAIDPAQRGQHETLAETLFGMIQEVRTLPDGYAFRLPSDVDVLHTVTSWVANERLCCHFLRFTLELEPDHGPLWIHLTGGDHVRAFVAATFSSVLGEQARSLRY